MSKESPESTSAPALDHTLRRLAPGRMITGRYRLEEMIGRGGMGVVWRAQDEMLDRVVALKFLSELLIHDPMALDDLKRETRRALELTHHNIVRVYDLVEDPAQDLACIAMEFFPGKTLARLRLLEPNHWFEPEQIAPWIGQLCDAMHYAHQKVGVVHRDLKPQNLMVDEKDEVKITDFGIARVASDSLARVSVGKISGTPCYMSSQQARGETPLPSDDIYSIGATLYELLSGRPPFWQGDIAHQLETMTAPPIVERRKELSGIETSVPAGWEETVAACLSKDVTQRPRSAREMAERLGIVLPSSRLGRPAPSVVAISRPPSSDVATVIAEEITIRGRPLSVEDAERAAVQGQASSTGFPTPASTPTRRTPSLPPRESSLISMAAVAPAAPVSGWAPLPSVAVAGYPSWSPAPPAAAPPSPAATLPLPPPPSPTSAVPIWVWVLALGFVFAGFAFFVGALVRHQFSRDRPAGAGAPAGWTTVRGAKTIYVPGDFVTIQAAIDAAKAGDTVRLRPGTYRESLVLKEGIRFSGEDASTCIVQPPPGAAAALFLRGGRGTSIENLTFTGGGTADPNVFSLGFDVGEDASGAIIRDVVTGSPAARAGILSGARLRSVDGQAIVEAAEAHYLMARGAARRDVTIEYDQGGTSRSVTLRTERRKLASVWPDGVVISNAEVAISNCVVQKFGGIGLLVYGAGTTGSISGNKFLDGRENGCSLIRTTAALQVTNNEFRRNAGAGLRFDNAEGLAAGNVCTANQSVGLHVAGRNAKPTLRGNTCTENAKSGLYFAEGGGGTAEDNTCDGNTDSGIFAFGQGTAPTLRGNRVRSNQKNGIVFADGATGLVERNTCELNEWPGLCATGSGTAPVFRNNRCVANKQSGIYFNTGASGTAERNYCAENTDAGLSVNGEGTNPRLVANEARENKQSGILFMNRSKGTAERNTCTGNKSSGISAGTGSVVALNGNTCISNALHGISFTGAASGTVSGNQCDENGDSGFSAFAEGTSPKFTGNFARRNKHYGIYFGSGAAGEGTGNTCEYNLFSGIAAANARTRPLLADNELKYNRKYGIEVFDGARATVGRNSYLQNQKGDRLP